MQQYFAKYLSLNRQLTLPGIGIFKTNIDPAQLAFTEKLLHPPAYTVSFLREPGSNDAQLITFLVNETGYQEQDVSNRLDAFINQLKANLEEGVAIPIAGIGTLNSTNDTYHFEAGNFEQFYPVITADKVLRKNVQHSIRVGEDQRTSGEMQAILHKEPEQDRWWVAALVLGAIGVAAILYHYISRS